MEYYSGTEPSESGRRPARERARASVREAAAGTESAGPVSPVEAPPGALRPGEPSELDSSESPMRPAGRFSSREALRRASPGLMEPLEPRPAWLRHAGRPASRRQNLFQTGR